ncbi:MAG: hypothetical protein JWO44_314 [Bacteroidetes bacterium]|nr:hypothetical protein [Bacteroidota bacterium]
MLLVLIIAGQFKSIVQIADLYEFSNLCVE